MRDSVCVTNIVIEIGPNLTNAIHSMVIGIAIIALMRVEMTAERAMIIATAAYAIFWMTNSIAIAIIFALGVVVGACLWVKMDPHQLLPKAPRSALSSMIAAS